MQLQARQDMQQEFAAVPPLDQVSLIARTSPQSALQELTAPTGEEHQRPYAVTVFVNELPADGSRISPQRGDRVFVLQGVWSQGYWHDVSPPQQVHELDRPRQLLGTGFTRTTARFSRWAITAAATAVFVLCLLPALGVGRWILQARNDYHIVQRQQEEMQKLAAARLAAAADREASITRALREEQQRRTQSELEIQAVQQQRQLDNLGQDALALLLRGEYGAGSRKLAQALDQLKIRHDTPGQVILLLSAGAAFQQKGNPAAAESHLLAAMEEMARLPEPDPSLTIELHAHLASTSRALHRPADAMLHLQQALKLREQMWKPDEQRLIPLLQDLALTAFDLQQFETAEAVCIRVMAIRSAHALERSPQAVDDLSVLALAQVRQGKFDHAGSACKLILTIEPVLDDAQKARLRRALMQLAHLYIEKSHFEQGLILLERALAIPRESGSAQSDDMDDWRLLAKLCLRERRFDQAEAILKKLIAAREASGGSDDPLLADDASELAELYERRNQLGEAEALYTLAMSIRERVLGPWHPDVARSAMRLADLFRIQGKAAEADALYQLAKEIRAQSASQERT